MSRDDARQRSQANAFAPPDDRQNEPPEDRTKIPAEHYCAIAKYGRHEFSRVWTDHPRGSGLTSRACWYCYALSPDSRTAIAAWERAQEGGGE